jgi:hypothetical protein
MYLKDGRKNNCFCQQNKQFFQTWINRTPNKVTIIKIFGKLNLIQQIKICKEKNIETFVKVASKDNLITIKRYVEEK